MGCGTKLPCTDSQVSLHFCFQVQEAAQLCIPPAPSDSFVAGRPPPLPPPHAQGSVTGM